MRNFRRMLLLAFIFVFCFTFAFNGMAEEAKESEVYGKVVLVNSENNYLNIESGGEKVAVLITTATRIVFEGKELFIKDINNGDVLKAKGFYVDKSIIADEIEIISRTEKKENAVIYTVFHDAKASLGTGDVLKVTLFGTPGGTAFFDVGDEIKAVKMIEVAEGKYEGEYTVDGKVIVENAVVAGYIILADGSKTIEKAGETVSFKKPYLKITTLSPEENSVVDTGQPHILIAIDSKEGKGIIPQTAALKINGKDVTSQAGISDYVISYLPPEPLSDGGVNVVFTGIDYDGNHITKEWSFTVKVPEAEEDIKITSLTHSGDKVLEAGDKLIVTMTGTPGGEATFDIGNLKTGISMKEGKPGVYTGEYTVAKDDKAENNVIICSLKKGTQKTSAGSDKGVSFNIAVEPVEPELTAPEIISPQNGSKVSLPIVVTGKTIAGYSVEITVSPKKAVDVGFFSVGEDPQTQTVTADAEGDFQASFTFVSGTEYTIKAVTINPKGEKSPETVIKLVK